MKIACAAFTDKGRTLLQRIQQAKIDDVFIIYDKDLESCAQWTKEVFASSQAICFVGAAGIAVRLIAPLITTKDKDPAVVVIDENGRFAIPLLAGHIGGANRLARELARTIGAEAVITTATDINGVFAVDEWSTLAGCRIVNVQHIKTVSATLLAGGQVGFYSDFPVVGNLPKGLVTEGQQAVGICVSLDENKKPFPTTLQVVPRIAVLGAGCRKNTSSQDFEGFVQSVLGSNSISEHSLYALASIDLKKHEECLVEFAKKRALHFMTFTAKELAKQEGCFSGSDFVKHIVGVDNVCERAAMAAGGEKPLLAKIRHEGMTMALSLLDWTCNFEGYE